VNIVAVCRGAPGLGRVVPAVALTQAIAASGTVAVTFASYGTGTQFLSAVGAAVVDLGNPDGLFIDSVAPQALRVLDLVHDTEADLVLIDGEFFLPAVLAHLVVPVLYLANRHDLTGPPNTFRRVNRLLLSYCDAVLISSLGCPGPTPRPGLIPGTTCLEVPALCRDIPLGYERSAGPPRVLVSTGGGSLRSPQLRDETDHALHQVLDVLASLTGQGMISTVHVVLGADATAPNPRHSHDGWLEITQGPVDLADLYRCHDLLITRAGRNTLAEAAYCGIPTVALPITADPHRAGEQHDNAARVTGLPVMFTPRDWHDHNELRDTVLLALEAAQRGIRSTGRRGNDSAASFARGFTCGDHLPQQGAVL
jgi:UDP:flavonoid glycosyltransferase YjiC (YdhE family)